MKSDRDRNPESRKGLRFARAAVPLAAVLLLAGCSSVPDWADPTEWFGSDSSAETSESAKETAAKTPGEGKDFPNLASVPARPKAPSEEERKRLADSLTADRENAEYSKDVIRRQSAASVPPPPPPPSASSVAAAVGTTAPSAATAAAAAAPTAPSAARPSVTPAPLPAPPAPVARTSPATGAALSPAPVSRPPQFAPRPPSPVAPAAGANTVAPLAVRPGPNARSVARIGNPSFGAPPGDIAAALGAGSPQQASRFGAPPPRVPGTFSNGTAAGGAEPFATVRFKAGSAALTGNARQQVRRVAAMFKQRGGAIRVEGHASSRTRNMDPVQHHLVNFNVSLNRANTVARELVRQGVPSESVFVAAMSDSQPLYYEVMPAGDAGNQRVEIHFAN